jgi:hypothetical protein
MSVVAVAVGGSAILGYVGAKQAASAQRDAANAATATQQGQYTQERTDSEPWRQAGISALNDLQDNSLAKNFSAADFNADPGYAFRMAEGQKAIERSAAARGGLVSGATAKALDKYTQNTASDEYNNAYNRYNNDRQINTSRLQSIAGLGQSSNAQVSAAGENMANNVAQNQMSAGNATAAGYVGGANAINNAVGQYANNWMQQQLLAKVK